METHVELITDGTVTIACVSAEIGGKYYHAHGNSRRMPQDKYDRSLGDALATMRAMDTIMGNLQRDLVKRVASLDKTE